LDISDILVQRTLEIDQLLRFTPHVVFGAIRELGPERLERCLAIELGGFQQILRLGQSLLSLRRTRIGRTGTFGIRLMNSGLPRESAS